MSRLARLPVHAPPTSFVSQADLTITELSSTSNYPWLADDDTETGGNNVDVFFNLTCGTDGVFDFSGDGYWPQSRVRWRIAGYSLGSLKGRRYQF